jgi:hypothetical protein
MEALQKLVSVRGLLRQKEEQARLEKAAHAAPGLAPAASFSCSLEVLFMFAHISYMIISYIRKMKK